MIIKVILPKLGMGATEATISEWFVKNGDMVGAGQVIYSIENDKAVEEIESPADGVISIKCDAGSTYPTESVVAEIQT